MLKTLLKALLALFILGVAVLAIWYRIDGITAPQAADYMTGEGYRSAETDDGSLVFTPAEPTGRGLVIMHGALIQPRSYAKTAAWFAARGYTVYVPYGPGRMSIALVNGMSERLSEFAVGEWYFIGHSMGGMASLESIGTGDLKVRAVALWAAAMPVTHRDFETPLLFIRGDNDGLLPPERFAQVQANLPARTEFVTLAGANHKNFALYSHQFFDNDATIDWDEQIDFANQTTAAFFRRYWQTPTGEN